MNFAKQHALSLPHHPMSLPPFQQRLYQSSSSFKGLCESGSELDVFKSVPRHASGKRNDPLVTSETWLPQKQLHLQERKPMGHLLRGRAGLEFAVKTEYSANDDHQCVFHVVEETEGVLTLSFRRQRFIKGIDPQPFRYNISIGWLQFKSLMATPTMSNMAFWVKNFRPTPQIETTIHSRAKSNSTMSRSDAAEANRLRKEFSSIDRSMRKHLRMNSAKLFEVSSTLGSTNSFSCLERSRSIHEG
jgi:hypothetical protein